MNVKEQRNMRCNLNFLYLLFFILKLTKANFFSLAKEKNIGMFAYAL